MNSVVHFEIPADDVERAKKFYSENFGWKLIQANHAAGRTVTCGRQRSSPSR